MRFSITGLLRLGLLLGLGSTLLAIEISRLEPKAARMRVLRKTNMVGISGLAFGGPEENMRFLDPDTGMIRQIILPRGEHFDNGACSPWQDETGASYVVGRWRKEEGSDGDEVMTDIGLACFSFPQGEEIARISCDVLPQGGACWYPGATDRVLFAAADGTLRHISFEVGPRARRGDSRASDAGMAIPLRWETEPPGGDTVMVRHPFWPSVPGFERTLIVSLRYLLPQQNEGYSAAQLWWLQLNTDGTAVVAAGRLTQPEDLPHDESAPSVAATPYGLALTYVTCSLTHLERKLMIAPVRIDPRTGAPRADSARAIVLAEDCADAPAGFSADGRQIFTVLHPTYMEARVGRFNVPADLARGNDPPSVISERGAHDVHAG